MEYGDVHRAMVQVFMSKQHMTEAETLNACRKVFTTYGIPEQTPNTAPELKQFFNLINEEIGDGGVGYAEIKRIKAEGHNEVVWGLGQVLLEEELDQEAKEGALKELRFLKDRELEYFKRLVEHLVTTKGKGGKIDHIKAYSIGQKLHENNRRSSGDGDEPAPKKYQNFTPVEASRLLERLEELGWLQSVQVESSGASHNNKRITLGIRSILDLQKYIETRYDSLCCVWTAGGDFKWLEDAAEEQEERNDRIGGEGKQPRNEGERDTEGDGENQEEEEEEEEEGSSSRSKRSRRS